MAQPTASGSVAVEPLGEPHLSFEPFVPAWMLAVLAAAVVLSALRSYARSTRPLTAFRRICLWLLRAAAALIVVLCLARPVLVQAKGLREKGLCFIALDASSSMNLRDAPQARTRWEYAGALFASRQGELSELGKRFEIRRLLFDARPREASRLPGEDVAAGGARPDGRATDLAALLERLAAEAGGSPCAGALVISDGRHNTLRDPLPLARALERAKLPLYVVGAGQEATPADFREVQVKLLEAPERAFVGGRIVLRAEVEWNLPGPAQTPLKVTINGETVKEELLELPGGEGVQRLEIPFTPTMLGMHRVVATVAPVPKEANLNNNTRAAYFRVYRSKLGVWFVEGAIRKEFGALRSALETAPNLRMFALNAFTRRAGPDRGLLPEKEEDWSELRLVLFGDLPAIRFELAGLERVSRLVSDGGAALMIGGVENFGAGGWQRSPLAEAWPVEMGDRDGAIDKPLAITVTPEGEVHPVLKLSDDPAQSRELWRRLPPLPGVNAVKQVKPAAKVLLRAGDAPLLVVQEYGKGRTAVFTGDMTWQWILKAGQADAHRRFWRNLVTWLTRSEYRDAGKAVFVDADRLLYMLGDEALLTAHVQETEETKGRIALARIVATLEVEGGPKKSWDLGKGVGEFSARNAPQIPGSYTFTVEALGAGGESLGRDSIGFQLDVPDVENDNPKANLKLLRKLAALSDGIYYDVEHAGEAFQQLLQRPSGFSKTVRESSELWNHWSLFLIFVLLLTLEWSLRKLWGLT